jgi:hypothetical protein
MAVAAFIRIRNITFIAAWFVIVPPGCIHGRDSELLISRHFSRASLPLTSLHSLMLSPIERLPVEVFDIISAYLDLPAYQSLRLTSRQLHLLTFSTFVKQCFSERTTTLGSTSLGRLVETSKHDHLRSVVRALHIRLLNHRDYKTLKAISRVAIFPPPKRFPRVSGVRDEHIKDEATTYDYVVKNEYPKRILNDLARALRGCNNLKVIRFRAKNSDPDGWQATVPEGDQLFRAKCFQVVLDAVVESGIQLEEFSMAKGKRTTAFYKSANTPYSALQLSPPSLRGLQHCSSFSHCQFFPMTIKTFLWLAGKSVSAT